MKARYGPARPHSRQGPRESPTLVRRTTPRLPKGGGLSRPPPERRRSLCNPRPREVKDDASRARRAPAHVEETISPLVQRRQGNTQVPKASHQRFPFRCNKTRSASVAGRLSPASPPPRHHHQLCRRRPPFVRIRCTSCPLSNLAVVGSLPAIGIREEDPGCYK